MRTLRVLECGSDAAAFHRVDRAPRLSSYARPDAMPRGYRPVARRIQDVLAR